ncbi:MAG: hypothetical protein ACRC62_26050 [Microcoleus sp.]
MPANNELTGFAGFADGSPVGSLVGSLKSSLTVRWHSNDKQSIT